MTRTIPSFAALILLVVVGQSAEVKVSSPDQKAVLTVTDNGGLNYRVFFDGCEVVSQSRFGILADGVDLGASVTLGKSSSRKIHESYAMFVGHSHAENNCRETTVSVRSAAGENYELDVRAYNDGVALRARLTPKPGRRINGEVSEWKLSGNPLAWYQTDPVNYEGIFQKSRLDDLRAGKKIPLPITFTLPGGGYALVTEANLLNYSDLGVQVAADHSLRAFFHANQSGWTINDAVVQPWRVTLLARDLNALVNSDLVRNLCPPAPPELAILSACDSGEGDVKICEGVMSLRRAFLIAGAQTVLASHWNISDKATSQLMTEFMRRWRSGEPRATAWRNAQLPLLHSKDFSNPYFWAAFTLTGQWR